MKFPVCFLFNSIATGDKTRNLNVMPCTLRWSQFNLTNQMQSRSSNPQLRNI